MLPDKHHLNVDLADPHSISAAIPRLEKIVATKRRIAMEAAEDLENWDTLLRKLKSVAGLLLRIEEPRGPNPQPPTAAAVDAIVRIVEQGGGPMQPVGVEQALISEGHEVENREAVFAVLLAAAEAGRLERVAPRRFAPLAPRQETPAIPTTVAVPKAHINLDGPEPQSKADAAIRILASNPDSQWGVQDVGKVMIERGWMTDSDSDLASLGSTLSRLHTEGKISRPDRGRYQLAPPEDQG